MINKKKFSNDKRFFIEKNVLKRIFYKPIYKYKIIKIKIGKIYRGIDNQIINLSETEVYKYLNNQINEQEYINYLKKYSRSDENHSIEYFKRLVENFKEYDLKSGAIIVDNLNVIVDGQHRACILLTNFGTEYEIEVVKIYYFGLHIKTYYKFIKKFLKDIKNKKTSG